MTILFLIAACDQSPQPPLLGYDPVSYFPEGGSDPEPGRPTLTASHEGRTYQFSSEQNRSTFLSDPERYEPEYDGSCAYAVAHGYKYDIDPESYLLVDGRLLLFYKGAMGDARAEFEREGVAEGVVKADANWPSLQ